MAALARVTSVTLDDAALEIRIEWESAAEIITMEADSLHAALVRQAAEDVVTAHFAHLGKGGYSIGEPRPD